MKSTKATVPGQPSKDIVLSEIEEAQIKAEWAQNELKYVQEEYIRSRRKAYPSIEDQLDTIYHKGVVGWKAEIKAIKDQYPKPAEE
jgi:hypothetical protein